jgi:hypothetical protein
MIHVKTKHCCEKITPWMLQFLVVKYAQFSSSSSSSSSSTSSSSSSSFNSESLSFLTSYYSYD